MNLVLPECQIKFDPNKVALDKIPVKSNFTGIMAETFGEWLAEKRLAAGLNQTELARRSRVTKATISLYEQDKIKQPRWKQLDKIALVLGIPKSEIRKAATSLEPIKPLTAREALERIEQLLPEFKGLLPSEGITDENAEKILDDFRTIAEIHRLRAQRS